MTSANGHAHTDGASSHGSADGSDVTVPILGTHEMAKKHIKPLSLLPLVALIFYDVSGGPFGIEDAVSAGGPLLAVLGFLVLPLVWSVPEAVMTAELATTFPENSGYVAWVTAAFGPFWGFQEGFWSWLSGVTDNAIYPVMFLTYLQHFLPQLATGWQRPVFLFSVSIALTYLNYRGLTVVGRAAVAMAAFILAPFLVMAALALPHVEPRRWLAVDWSAVDWTAYINVMFWNLNYWDSVSTLAGEVPNPARTFPRALAAGVAVVVASYLVPLLVGLGTTTNPADWQLGFFAALAKRVGGEWLSVWVLLAAACSQIGQFEAEMSSDSFQLLGMAERGFLPAALARRSRYDTPTLAILLSSLGITIMVSFSFIQIVQLLNIIYCLGELLEFAAFIWLRIKAPDMERPYRVPLPTWGVVLMLLPASALLVVLLVLPIVQQDWQVIGWTLGAIAAGFSLYPLLGLARARRWCEFTPLSPRDFDAMLAAGIHCSASSALLAGSQRHVDGALPSEDGSADGDRTC